MLTSTQRLPSSVTPLHLEGGEGELEMHGPMPSHEKSHSRQELLQKEGAILKRQQNQERNMGKNLEEGELHEMMRNHILEVAKERGLMSNVP